LNLEEELPFDLVLVCDAGSSAKLIRLLGVDMLELGVLPPPRSLVTTSGKLRAIGVFTMELEWVKLGLGEARDKDMEEGERFMADRRGGEGRRVEEECTPLVKNREMDAVAVEVPASATYAGLQGKR